MLLNIAEIFYKDVSNLESFNIVEKQFIKETKESERTIVSFLEEVYKNHFSDKGFEEALGYTKRDKFLRRKTQWVLKATEGLNEYHTSGKIGRGFYNHLISNYLKYKEAEAECTQDMFVAEYNANNAEEKIEQAVKQVINWGKSNEMMLCQYPFFGRLTKVQRLSSIEIDAAMILGSWLIEKWDNLTVVEEQGELFYTEKVDISTTNEFKRQAPSTTLDTPFWGVAKKLNYPLTTENDDEKLIPIRKKSKFEMDDNYTLSIDSGSELLLVNTKKTKEEVSVETTNSSKGTIKSIRTPDSFDWRIFIDIINKRDSKFNTSKSIIVYLSDLVNSNYQSDSAFSYSDLTTRLLKLADYQITYTTPEGTMHFKRLISKMDIEKDENNKKYVRIFVTEDVHDNVLKEECINVYNKEIQEIKDDLAYHLVFVLQKERIINYNPHSEDEYIKFELGWEDFISLRMNKRTKKENFDEIEAAFKVIKERGIILKSYARFGTKKFFISCFPLNTRELEDSNKFKLKLPENGTALLMNTSK